MVRTPRVVAFAILVCSALPKLAGSSRRSSSCRQSNEVAYATDYEARFGASAVSFICKQALRGGGIVSLAEIRNASSQSDDGDDLEILEETSQSALPNLQEPNHSIAPVLYLDDPGSQIQSSQSLSREYPTSQPQSSCGRKSRSREYSDTGEPASATSATDPSVSSHQRFRPRRDLRHTDASGSVLDNFDGDDGYISEEDEDYEGGSGEDGGDDEEITLSYTDEEGGFSDQTITAGLVGKANQSAEVLQSPQHVSDEEQAAIQIASDQDEDGEESFLMGLTSAEIAPLTSRRDGNRVAHPLLEQARLEVSLARTAVREGPEAMPMIGLEVDLAAWGEENLMKGVTIPVKRWKAHLWGQRLAAARRHNCALLSYMQNVSISGGAQNAMVDQRKGIEGTCEALRSAVSKWDLLRHKFDPWWGSRAMGIESEEVQSDNESSIDVDRGDSELEGSRSIQVSTLNYTCVVTNGTKKGSDDWETALGGPSSSYEVGAMDEDFLQHWVGQVIARGRAATDRRAREYAREKRRAKRRKLRGKRRSKRKKGDDEYHSSDLWLVGSSEFVEQQRHAVRQTLITDGVWDQV